MATKRIPWIDDDYTEPELYETPDTAETQDVVPHWAAFGGEDHHEAIDKQKLDASEAGRVFQNESLDGENVDFSGALDHIKSRSLRRQYRTDFEETIEERLARLRREIEEVKLETEERETGGSRHESCHTLERMFIALAGRQTEAASRLSRKIAESPRTPALNTSAVESIDHGNVAGLEARISGMEKTLGESLVKEPLLPALEDLSARIEFLTSSPPRLDAIRSQLRDMVAENEKLIATKKKADDTKATPEDSRIDSLYAALSSIDSLAPTLGPTIDRLHSLRIIHENAALSYQTVTAIENKQAAIADGIRTWEDSLHQMRGVISKSERQTLENVTETERLVKSFEFRNPK